MERSYIKVNRRSDLKLIRKSFPPKKIFIMINGNTLFTELTEKERTFLLQNFELSVCEPEEAVES